MLRRLRSNLTIFLKDFNNIPKILKLSSLKEISIIIILKGFDFLFFMLMIFLPESRNFSQENNHTCSNFNINLGIE